jgi:hypothetical protein
MYRCPYCRSGHGDIAFDTDRLIDWMLKNQHLKSDDISTDHRVHPAVHTLVFNPGFPRGQACDHLVTAGCTATLCEAECFLTSCISEVIIDYRHPWFGCYEGELRDDYIIYAMDRCRKDVSNHPRFGSIKVLWADEWIAAIEHEDEVLLLHAFGRGQYVERPDVFFRDFPRDFDRGLEWDAEELANARTSE